MVRNITLILMALSVWTSVKGQTSRFEIGLEGGPSLTSLRGNEILEDLNDPTAGYSGGMTFQFNFSKLVSIRTATAYERKGDVANIDFIPLDGYSSQAQIRSNFDYLTMPLLARLNFGSKVKFFINAGPYFAYLSQHTEEIVILDFPESKIEDTNNYKRLDVGLSGGLGCGFPIQNTLMLTIEARHNRGLYNTSKGVFNYGKIMTNSTNLLLGLAYRFGKNDERTELKNR